jgi:hypothetical protein
MDLHIKIYLQYRRCSVFRRVRRIRIKRAEQRSVLVRLTNLKIYGLRIIMIRNP